LTPGGNGSSEGSVHSASASRDAFSHACGQAKTAEMSEVGHCNARAPKHSYPSYSRNLHQPASTNMLQRTSKCVSIGCSKVARQQSHDSASRVVTLARTKNPAPTASTAISTSTTFAAPRHDYARWHARQGLAPSRQALLKATPHDRHSTVLDDQPTYL
jgi:hypothetical protein